MKAYEDADRNDLAELVGQEMKFVLDRERNPENFNAEPDTEDEVDDDSSK
uniref:Uncharacterized protein n=1 Tax=Kalanchoe fedtschenkoi TaxID=63787 RepID=A0A7N0UN66_KALFE